MQRRTIISIVEGSVDGLDRTTFTLIFTPQGTGSFAVTLPIKAITPLDGLFITVSGQLPYGIIARQASSRQSIACADALSAPAKSPKEATRTAIVLITRIRLNGGNDRKWPYVRSRGRYWC